MKKIMILAMLFCFATASTALAQTKKTEAQRINVTGTTDVSKQKAPKKQLQTKDARKDSEKLEKAAQQKRAQNGNATGLKDDKETVKRYRSIERVTKSEEELSLAEEMKTKAQEAYIELQQKHMSERESLKKKQAQERLAGVTDELIARQDLEMKELLARQSNELDAAKRDRERANKQYNRALTEYEKARNERLKYE